MKRALRMVSLCAGIGGADLVAEATGAIEIVGQVERDRFCQAVLSLHWPHVLRFADLKEITGDEFGPIDLLVAGLPCQPYSLAGKRRGSQDERNLWPDAYRILCASLPRWYVGENVPGLLTIESGRFFASMLASLVTLGYGVAWAVYGACEIGAPHKRERIFLVAHRPGIRSRTRFCESTQQEWAPDIDCSRTGTLANAESRECGRGKQYSVWPDIGTSCTKLDNTLREEFPKRRGQDRSASCFPIPLNASDDCCTLPDPLANTACSNGARTRKTGKGMDGSTVTGPPDTPAGWGPAERAISRNGRDDASFAPAPVRDSSRQETGAPTPEPFVGRVANGFPRGLDSHLWPAAPGQPQHREEPSRTVSERMLYHNQRLKALGNAMVPQQIAPIFAEIVAWEKEERAS